MKIQKQISQRWNPFSDFALDCKSEIRILESKSRFPNRTHPKLSICEPFIFLVSGEHPAPINTAQRFPTESKYILRGFVAERKGERFDMQDAHVICDDFLEEFDTKPTGM